MDSDQAITVKYNGDHEFEILVKPGEAFAYKRGEQDDFSRILFVREIFKDAQSAERASAADIEDEFNTKNIVEAAEQIFNKGKLELTTDQKNQMREEKRKQVVSLIARRAMDPQTGNPHPPQRIENALEEVGFHADPMEPAEKQFQGAVDSIKSKIPISLDEKELAVRIPNKYAGKCYGKIKNLTHVLEEDWGDDAFMARVQLPAGMKEKLVTELNSVCHGDLEIKDL